MCEESMGVVGNGSHKFVLRGEAGVGDVFVVKVHGVTEAIAVGGLDVAKVRMVVFGGCIDVPPINGVESPCPARVGFLVNLGIASHGR